VESARALTTRQGSAWLFPQKSLSDKEEGRRSHVLTPARVVEGMRKGLGWEQKEVLRGKAVIKQGMRKRRDKRTFLVYEKDFSCGGEKNNNTGRDEENKGTNPPPE